MRERHYDRNGAIKLFQKVVQLNPRSGEDVYLLGVALLKGKDLKPFGPGSDPQAALKVFQEAISIDPSLKKAHHRIAAIRLWMGRQKKVAP